MTELLTLAQLSQESGYPVKTLYRFLAPAGDLACIRTQVGPSAKRRTSGRIRVTRADWNAWVARHRTAPAETTTGKRAPGPRLSLPGADRYVQ